jgi:hypothetical protein
MLRNRFRQARRHRRLRLAARGSIVGLAGLWLAASVAAATFTAARSTADPSESAALLSALFALVVVGGFIGAAGAALQTFYLATDLPFLLSLPIPLRVTFSAKFVEAMAGSSPVALILAAALGGYWAARGERWWTLAAAAAIGLLVLAATTSLAVMVVAGIGRVLPPRRTGSVLGILSLTLVVLLWASYATISPNVTAAGTSDGEGGNAFGRALIAAGERIAWSPIGWAARAVVAAADGDLVVLAERGALFVATTVALALSAFVLFTTSFARAYGGYRMAAVAIRQPDRPLGRWVAFALAPLPRPLAALVLKEWLTMFRDLRRLSGAVWPLGMVGIYTVLLSRGNEVAPSEAPGLGFWMSCGTLALVPWGASLGISIYAFGSERRQIDLLRAVPIAPRTLLLAKVLASLIPVLILGEGAATIVGAAQGASRGQFLALLGLVAWATIGYVLIDTAAAAIAPNFDAEQIQRSTALAGRIVGFLAGAVFTIASGAAATRLIFFATGVPNSLRPVLEWEPAGIALLGWPLVAGAAALALGDVLVFLAVALDRVAAIIRDGE